MNPQLIICHQYLNGQEIVDRRPIAGMCVERNVHGVDEIVVSEPDGTAHRMSVETWNSEGGYTVVKWIDFTGKA